MLLDVRVGLKYIQLTLSDIDFHAVEISKWHFFQWQKQTSIRNQFSGFTDRVLVLWLKAQQNQRHRETVAVISDDDTYPIMKAAGCSFCKLSFLFKKKSRQTVFQSALFRRRGEILLKGKKIRKILSEAALIQISSLNDPSFSSNSHFKFTLKVISWDANLFFK